jgi:hypothetical protein
MGGIRDIVDYGKKELPRQRGARASATKQTRVGPTKQRRGATRGDEEKGADVAYRGGDRKLLA